MRLPPLGKRQTPQLQDSGPGPKPSPPGGRLLGCRQAPPDALGLADHLRRKTRTCNKCRSNRKQWKLDNPDKVKERSKRYYENRTEQSGGDERAGPERRGYDADASEVSRAGAERPEGGGRSRKLRTLASGFCRASDLVWERQRHRGQACALVGSKLRAASRSCAGCLP